MGFLTNLIGGVMDDVIEKQRENNEKYLKEKGNKEIQKLEEEARLAGKKFSNLAKSRGYINDSDVERLGL